MSQNNTNIQFAEHQSGYLLGRGRGRGRGHGRGRGRGSSTRNNQLKAAGLLVYQKKETGIYILCCKKRKKVLEQFFFHFNSFNTASLGQRRKISQLSWWIC
jgi:hypothetical protein